jgi:hypothetical protein
VYNEKKVTWGTNENLSIYVGGLRYGVKKQLYLFQNYRSIRHKYNRCNRSRYSTYLLKTASTGQSVIQGKI